MLVWFGKKTKVKTVRGGRVTESDCPECHQQARFVECIVSSTWTAYSILDLSDSEERLFRCSECAELFEISEPLQQVDPAVEARLRELRTRKAKIETALRKKHQAIESAKRKRDVNFELESLKRKLKL